MRSVSEERQRLLSEKLQELGDIGVGKRHREDAPFFDQPVELEAETPTAEARSKEAFCEHSTKSGVEALCAGDAFEAYQARFFAPSREARGKVGFTIHWELLQTLRDVLNDVRSRATLTAYIENIILEHLREHRAMLNRVAAHNKRTPTISQDL